MARTVGERLLELRNERNWTQKQMGKRAGVSHFTIWRIENNISSRERGKDFYPRTINKILDSLGVTLDEFMRGVIIE